MSAGQGCVCLCVVVSLSLSLSFCVFCVCMCACVFVCLCPRLCICVRLSLSLSLSLFVSWAASLAFAEIFHFSVLIGPTMYAPTCTPKRLSSPFINSSSFSGAAQGARSCAAEWGDHAVGCSEEKMPRQPLCGGCERYVCWRS